MNVIGTVAADEAPRGTTTPGSDPVQRSFVSARDDENCYVRVRQLIVDVVTTTVPEDSTVLVITKGDEELLNVPPRRAWHFPRATSGQYAGCYPADSDEAIRHLERLRLFGAEYLVIPQTSFWWLEFYERFTAHLQQHYRIVAYLESVCIVYRLSGSN